MRTSNLLQEYFLRRLFELAEEEEELIRSIRTKTGLIILCDKLRAVEVRKAELETVYEDLKRLM